MIGSDQTELFDVTELIIGVILSLHSAHLYNYYLFTIATRTCLYSLSTFTLHVSYHYAAECFLPDHYAGYCCHHRLLSLRYVILLRPIHVARLTPVQAS
jgi:hypothetical protein